MQHLFTWVSVALAIILIYSLRVNGVKLKNLQQEQEKEIERKKEIDYETGCFKHQYSSLLREVKELKFQNKELVERIMGERVCDGYCRSCTNSVEYQNRISCKLDCKCKDFNAKEERND